jgi:catechol 2,3-dioxygenase-like lactoylglutathione lyase family enzyme
MVAIGPIALFVPDLQEAETFYQHVFDMHLLMREAVLDDDLWYALPAGKGWDDAEAVGIELGMLALRRDAFILALFQGNPVPEDTVLEIGIRMADEAIAAVRDRLPDAVEIAKHERGDLMFRDRFGYLWHVWPAGVAFQSNGEGEGRWLEV